jgi:hypothetical protein
LRKQQGEATHQVIKAFCCSAFAMNSNTSFDQELSYDDDLNESYSSFCIRYKRESTNLGRELTEEELSKLAAALEEDIQAQIISDKLEEQEKERENRQLTVSEQVNSTQDRDQLEFESELQQAAELDVSFELFQPQPQQHQQRQPVLANNHKIIPAGIIESVYNKYGSPSVLRSQRRITMGTPGHKSEVDKIEASRVEIKLKLTQAELAEKRSQVELAAQLGNNLIETNEQLNQQLQQQSEERNHEITEIQTLSQEISRLNSLHTQTHNKYTHTQRSLNEMIDKYNSAVEDLTAAQQQVHQLLSQQNNYLHIKQSNEKLQDSFNQIQGELSSLQSEQRSLLSNYSVQCEKNSRLKLSLQESNKEIMLQTKEILALQDEANKRNNQMSHIRQILVENEQVKQQMELLQGKLTAKQRLIHLLQEELTRIKSEKSYQIANIAEGSEGRVCEKRVSIKEDFEESRSINIGQNRNAHLASLAFPCLVEELQNQLKQDFNRTKASEELDLSVPEDDNLENNLNQCNVVLNTPQKLNKDDKAVVKPLTPTQKLFGWISEKITEKHNIIDEHNIQLFSNQNNKETPLKQSIRGVKNSFSTIKKSIQNATNNAIQTPLKLANKLNEDNEGIVNNELSDPLKEYFHLTCIAIKLNSNNDSAKTATYNIKLLYEQVIQQDIPFHQWHDWISKEFTRIAQNSNGENATEIPLTVKARSQSVISIEKTSITPIQHRKTTPTKAFISQSTPQSRRNSLSKNITGGNGNNRAANDSIIATPALLKTIDKKPNHSSSPLLSSFINMISLIPKGSSSSSLKPSTPIARTALNPSPVR